MRLIFPSINGPIDDEDSEEKVAMVVVKVRKLKTMMVMGSSGDYDDGGSDSGDDDGGSDGGDGYDDNGDDDGSEDGIRDL